MTPGIPKIPVMSAVHHTTGIATPGMRFKRNIAPIPIAALMTNLSMVLNPNLNSFKTIASTTTAAMPMRMYCKTSGIRFLLFVTTMCFLSAVYAVRRAAVLAAAHEASFSQYPDGHCSFPPRLRRLCSRKSRCAAI